MEVEKAEQKGEKGVVKGMRFAIKSLMENTGTSVEQAMTVLKAAEEERSKYAELLEKP